MKKKPKYSLPLSKILEEADNASLAMDRLNPEWAKAGPDRNVVFMFHPHAFGKPKLKRHIKVFQRKSTEE